MATRKASGEVLKRAPVLPELWGGSADLAESNNTTMKGEPSFVPAEHRHQGVRRPPYGRTLHFGIREHGMGAILNGIALHGRTRPYGGTFLVFSDYMRPAVRLAALMKLPVIYVWTHDSIGLGEDGPTHQPIEHLAALRAIPGLDVVRPADANETAVAWRTVLEHTDRPAGPALTRQNLPVFDRRARLGRGRGQGRVRAGRRRRRRRAAGDPDRHRLGGADRGRRPRAARRPTACPPGWCRCRASEWFHEQDEAYRESVLPRGQGPGQRRGRHRQPWHVVGDAGENVRSSTSAPAAPTRRCSSSSASPPRTWSPAPEPAWSGGRHQRVHHRKLKERNTMSEALRRLSDRRAWRSGSTTSPARGCAPATWSSLIADKHVVGVTTNPTIFAKALSRRRRVRRPGPRPALPRR